jgi:hypothetical protein
MRQGLTSICIGLAVYLLACSAVMAQPVTNLLGRILMVESSFGRGTIFMLDIDRREYWITAKHLLNGATDPHHVGTIKKPEAVLKMLNPTGQGEEWIAARFTVIDPGNDIDIVVLAPPEPLLKTQLDSIRIGAATLGAGCGFLGFPYGAAYRAKYKQHGTIWLPFVKRCSVAAIIDEPRRIWVLEGINSSGFAGGPVFTGTSSGLTLFGVVSYFGTDPLDVLPENPAVKPDPSHTNQRANVNPGFFVAHNIQYALDAIQRNPLGALRENRRYER